MIAALRTAIEGKLDDYATVYSDIAPVGAPNPYLLITYPSGLHDYDSVETYPLFTVQVAGYALSQSVMEALEANIISALDRKQSTFSLTSYYITDISLKFQSRGGIDGKYYFIHQYKFDIDPK